MRQFQGFLPQPFVSLLASADRYLLSCRKTRNKTFCCSEPQKGKRSFPPRCQRKFQRRRREGCESPKIPPSSVWGRGGRRRKEPASIQFFFLLYARHFQSDYSSFFLQHTTKVGTIPHPPHITCLSATKTPSRFFASLERGHPLISFTPWPGNDNIIDSPPESIGLGTI